VPFSGVTAGVALASASAAAAVGFHASARPLDTSVRRQVVTAHAWSVRCPVPLSHLRLLAVRYRGFDARSHTGELVVNEDAVQPLTRVFRRLYALGFPIHHMQLVDAYGARARRPADGDFSASFECR
jgi:hypothetical protein